MMTAKLFENGRSQAVEKNRIAISLFLSPITILDFDSYAADNICKIDTDHYKTRITMKNCLEEM